jgi:bud emergence protein 1
MEDGRHWELSRYYADFYDFQIALLENFPEEAGNKGKSRTLPFMPGPVAHVTDAISNGRRQNLDEYIRNILSMPPHISKCMLVRKLFAPRHGDFEIDPNAIGEDYRLSGTSQQSASRDLSNQGSRQSSNSQQGYTSASAAISRAARDPRSQPPMSASAASGFAGPHLHTQASTLTQGSTASSAKASGGAMKIKVHLSGEIVAIRVPQDISYDALKAKIRDRLGVNDDILIQYHDGSTDSRVDLVGDEDLDAAIQRNPTKLALYVEYVDQ